MVQTDSGGLIDLGYVFESDHGLSPTSVLTVSNDYSAGPKKSLPPACDRGTPFVAAGQAGRALGFPVDLCQMYSLMNSSIAPSRTASTLPFS